MKPRAAIALALIPLVVGCWWPLPDRTVTPKEVRSHIHGWNGKTVTVGGWLGRCAGYDCHLHTTKSDMTTVEMRKDDDDWIPAFDRGIGIGSAPGFDEKAGPLQFQYVEITGRVNDMCHPWIGPGGCLDRAPDLEPISILAAKPPKESM